jgi:hypothetical protein
MLQILDCVPLDTKAILRLCALNTQSKSLIVRLWTTKQILDCVPLETKAAYRG